MHRSMRNLSFVDVVPLDTLLDALASDSSQVAQRVHRLLLPSYFSGPEEGPACVAALLRQSPEVHTPQLCLAGPCHNIFHPPLETYVHSGEIKALV